MGLVDAVTNNLEGGESEGIYFEADARTLGLRVLVPPEEEEKTSEAAKKTMKEKKEAGTNGKRKGGPDSSNKKDDGDKSFQMIADDRPKAAAIGDNDATIPSILPQSLEPIDVFPADRHTPLGLDNFGDDASFMSDLERLTEETKEVHDNASGSMVGNISQHSSAPHAPTED